MVTDITSAALHSALRGLSTRRRVIAANVANVDTPGYLAGTVSFEDSIADALSSARPGSGGAVSGITPSTGVSTAATRLNGNNVNIDDEVLAQTTNELAYSTILEAMNGKFRLLRTAISGQA